MEPSLIAPCGFNCALCSAYQKHGRPCLGCRGDAVQQKHCENCLIRKCELLAATESGFCFECGMFPCKRLKRLDARYRKQHSTSLIDNLKLLEANGMEALLQSEKKRWTCRACGKTLSIHSGSCLHCSAKTE